MWFVDVGTDHVGRITPAGAETLFEVPGVGDGSRAIVAGPDGNMWMVARQGFDPQDWILRITASGQVTKFAAGEGRGEGTGPAGITVGPDRNLWFTELAANRIGRMTADGQLAEFPLPSPESSPQGIVTGPDGSLWFTESSRGHPAIGRITLLGAITEFPLGNSDLFPESIISGPDHNLWFSGLGEIDRITPAGVVTRFQGVGESGGPDLAVGADGNIWFADSAKNAIGRLDMSGKIRLFSLPRVLSEPAGIAAGADGRMWFTESGANRVGTIGLTVPEVTLSAAVLSFGSAQSVLVKNTGDGPLLVASVRVAGADATAFQVNADDCSGKRVPAGVGCQVRLSYSGGTGTAFHAARLEITDNGTGSPQVVSLVGQLTECRLPAVTVSQDRAPPVAGFLAVPAGPVTPDTTAGDSPVIFVRSFARWLPVPASWIAPDGKRYITAKPAGVYEYELHIVDIATGADRPLMKAGPYFPLAFGPEGIYVNIPLADGPGLWLVNPDTGLMHELLSSEVVEAIGNGAAWIGDVNTRDPNPALTGLGTKAPNELLRRDLATGQSVPWFYQPGERVSVQTVSGGMLLVSGAPYFTAQPEYWIVTGPNEASKLVAPGTGDPLWAVGGMVADRQGVWVGTIGGLYFWTARTGPVLVSDYYAVNVAGTCA